MSEPASDAGVRLADPDRGVMLAHVGAGAPRKSELRALVRDPRAGAVLTFEGVTREVDAIEYEAYARMAAEQLLEVAAAALLRHGACRVAASHRTGTIGLGEPSITIVVSAPHRDEAYAASRAVIDEVKRLVPIWKVEVDGSTRRRVPGQVPGTVRAMHRTDVDR